MNSLHLFWMNEYFLHSSLAVDWVSLGCANNKCINQESNCQTLLLVEQNIILLFKKVFLSSDPFHNVVRHDLSLSVPKTSTFLWMYIVTKTSESMVQVEKCFPLMNWWKIQHHTHFPSGTIWRAASHNKCKVFLFHHSPTDGWNGSVLIKKH